MIDSFVKLLTLGGRTAQRCALPALIGTLAGLTVIHGQQADLRAERSEIREEAKQAEAKRTQSLSLEQQLNEKSLANDMRDFKLGVREAAMAQREQAITDIERAGAQRAAADAVLQRDAEIRAKLDQYVDQYVAQNSQFGSTIDHCTQDAAYKATGVILQRIATMAPQLSDGGKSYLAFVEKRHMASPIMAYSSDCNERLRNAGEPAVASNEVKG